MPVDIVVGGPGAPRGGGDGSAGLGDGHEHVAFGADRHRALDRSWGDRCRREVACRRG